MTNEYPEIVSALSDSLDAWDCALPNSHHEGFPGEVLSFDPNALVSNLALPNIDLGPPVPKPTRPPTVPTTVPTPNPTAPTVTPTRRTPPVYSGRCVVGL
jgi:hypothetical protein